VVLLTPYLTSFFGPFRLVRIFRYILDKEALFRRSRLDPIVKVFGPRALGLARRSEQAVEALQHGEAQRLVSAACWVHDEACHHQAASRV
jgi:hypothetical protein